MILESIHPALHNGWLRCTLRHNDGSTNVVYYHQWVWYKEHGFFPPQGMVIHHIDGNKLNNKPNNLKMMPKSEHATHHLLQRPKKGIPMITLNCVECGLPFERRKSVVKQAGKYKSGPFCSLNCKTAYWNRRRT